MDSRGTVFREIHKNTWLKRLTLDNKKITVGSKKSERTWVVFCVHDDSEAILEGYIEPRQAAFHIPEWTVPLQTTLHISHALVPSESEYEFVITLATDVIRFNASSWEIMQEWVETLRQKLREMKILSPKENLYSKLPEIRAPLLPTRDPTSPLPAPPPVPAAIVPGIEQITPSSTARAIITSTATSTISSASVVTTSTQQNQSNSTSDATSSTVTTTTVTSSHATTTITSSLPATAMSNTLTQNLINMLSNPVSTYSSQVTAGIPDNSSESSLSEENFFFDEQVTANQSSNEKEKNRSNEVLSLAKTFSNNVLADPNTCPSTSGLSAQSLKTSGTEREVDTESSGESTTSVIFKTEPLIIPRPQTSRNSSRSKRTPTSTQSIQQPFKQQPQAATITSDESSTTNITIIQVSSPLSIPKHPHKDIFNFPSATVDPITESANENFKSNVQIIPSNLSPPSTSSKSIVPVQINEQKVTTVQVTGSTSLATGYGKIIQQSTLSNPPVDSSPVISLSENSSKVKNFGSVTNIPIGPTATTTQTTSGHQPLQRYYEQVFVTSSSSSSSSPSNATTDIVEHQTNQQPVVTTSPKVSLVNKQTNKQKSTSHTEIHVNRINLHNNRNKENNEPESSGTVPSVTATASASTSTAAAVQTVVLRNVNNSTNSGSGGGSGSGNTSITSNGSNNNSSSSSNSNNRKHVITGGKRENLSSPLPAIRQFLTRGLTEAAIIRPSRKDNGSQANRSGRQVNLNTNKVEVQTDNVQQELREQRRRSSSTSDAQGIRTRTNANIINSPPQEPRRMQPAPQPFRPENSSILASGRLTLREQQVLQLRREMMHPGGVRLQLRRKDCTGSIALVDAFGAIWISGWKQKDHPMLYNALHIGDQLVSVGGISVSNASDANRIIRNSPGLYIEFIIRRIPFGRVYAIRREIEGQCIGLIRDGNTATIVDVVPNSLSARHGLPPKAQTCDGLSLTFWVLTEINGRPLNLFFKDNEVRDRINAVGRDISILVQPSDLITKLKKQLKSLRGYKDYIVQ